MPPKTVLKTEVCVLGAGPAGMTLANLLHQQRIPCLVLERRTPKRIRAVGRAGIMEWTTVSLLEQHGLADRLLQRRLTQDRCEFRLPDRRFLFKYGKLNGGKPHTVYPQSELNAELIDAYLKQGGPARWGVQAVAIAQADGQVTVDCVDEHNAPLHVHCAHLAGCDGAQALSRRSLPAGAVREYRQDHGINWLALQVRAQPAFSHTIYALHPEGFAAFLMRNDHICRYYVQVPKSDRPEGWDDERIWGELKRRLMVAADEPLHQGEVFEKTIVTLRSLVTEPMRFGRVFLAGDAAHLIPPTGAKGMNLAIHDAAVLAQCFVDYFEKGDEAALDRYSEQRLALIWRAQNFSLRLMHMLHGHPKEANEESFEQKLWSAKLQQLETSPSFGKDFAKDFVGIT